MCKMLQAYMLPALKGLIASFDRRGTQITEETHSAHPSSAKTLLDTQPSRKRDSTGKGFLEKEDIRCFY